MRGGGGRLAVMSALYALLLAVVVAVGSVVPVGWAARMPLVIDPVPLDPVPLGPMPSDGAFGPGAIPIDADLDQPCEVGSAEPPAAVAKALQAWGEDVQCIQVRGDIPRLAAIRVSGVVAIDAWTDVAAAAEGSRWWPVLLGSPISARGQLEAAAELVEQTGDRAADVLRAAAAVDVDGWFARREDDILGGGEYPLSHERLEPANDFDWATPYDSFSGDWLSEVVLVAVPADDSASAAAVLQWGCWNDNPCPAEHVAILREWHERYGADVVGMAQDILELRVTRPPDDWDEAVALAKQHYLYDHDIVDQGTGSIEALAASLLEAPGWRFWWD